MKFQVEEDIEAAVAKGFDKAIASGVVEFHAYFEPAAGAGETVYQVEREFCSGEVQGHGQAVFWLEGIVG